MSILRSGLLNLKRTAFQVLVVLGSALHLFGATLVWDANTESNLAGYNVYYGLQGGSTVWVDVGLQTSLNLDSLELIPGTTYNFYVTAYNTDGIESDPSASVSYAPPFNPSVTPPIITRSPVSQTLALKQQLTLSVQATGTGTLYYQWYKDGDLLPGATNATWSVASVQATDAASYTARVSNAGGAVTSAAAVVVITTPPVISKQPATQSVNAGDSLALSVSATGAAPLSYQWYKNSVSISGVTASTYSISVVQTTDAGSYSVRVSNSLGSVLSATATITVLNAPVITKSPASQTVAPGGTVTLTAEATGAPPLTFQWFKDGVSLTGATNTSLSISGIRDVDAGSYSVRVSNSAGSALSQNAVITILSAPVITQDPVSQTITAGRSASLSVTATGAGTLKYQWVKNGSIVSGATNAVLSIPSVQSSDAGVYTVSVSNSGGSAASKPATLTIISPPSITRNPLSQTVNAGNALSMDVEAIGSAPLTFQWLKSGVEITGATNSIFSIVSVKSSDAGNFSVRVQNSVGAATSQDATLTVIAPPVITKDLANQTVNANSSLTLSIEANGSGTLTYQWVKNGSLLNGASGPSFSIPSVQPGDAGIYSVRVSNSAGSVSSRDASITVLTPPLITQDPVSQSVNIGLPLNLTVQAAGSGMLSYQWLKDGSVLSGATNATYTVGAVLASHAGNYSVRVSNNAGSVTSQTATVTVLTAPIIAVQPLGRTVNAGSSFSLTVQATGSGLFTYQWFKDGVALSGANSATFSIASAQTSHAGSYSVRVANSAGSVLSDPAVVNVVTTPTIIEHPASQSVKQGSALTLTAQASGSGTLAYQWLKNGTTIPGANATSYSIASVQSSDAGSYAVRVSNSAGSVTSDSAVITVLTAPLFTQNPVSQSINAGSALTLTAAATGSAPLSFQWLKNGTPISGATSATFSIPSVQSTDAANYSVRASNSVASVTSETAVISVLTAPVITQQPASQSVDAGAALTLVVQATGSGSLTYQWLKNGSAISGATSATFSIASVQTGDAGSYSARVSNSAGSTMSDAAVITVRTPPVITQNPVGRSVNAGTAVTFTVVATGSNPLTYQWFKDGVALNSASSASFTVSSAQASDAGNYLVRVSNSAGTAESSAALLTVVVPPVITQNPQSQSVNAGAALTLKVQASGSGSLSYQWSRNGSTIGGANSATYSIATVQSSDAGNYAVHVSNTAGAVDSTVAVVTVLSAPVITQNPVSQSVNEGSPVTLTVAATGSGTLNYQWLKNGVAIPGAVSSTFSIASSASSDDGTYSVRVSNSVGTSTSIGAIVSILTAPVITTQPASQTLNQGTSLTLNVQASGSGTLDYQWYKNGALLAGATSASYAISFIQPADAGTYSVRVSNEVGAVTSLNAVVVVRTPPIITSQPVSQTLDFGVPLNLSVQASGTGTLSYRWIKDGSFISGANSSTFSITAVASADAGIYSVEVSNSAGTITSAGATIAIVGNGLPTISTQPQPKTLNAGAALTLSVVAAGPGSLSYQWYKNGSPVNGATTTVYAVPSVSAADTGIYSVRVKNSIGTTISDSVTVTVQTSPVISRNPLGQSLTAGSILTLNVEAAGSGTLNYQWQKDGINITGATSSSYSVGSVTAADGGSYIVRVSNSVGATSSQAAVVTVVTPPLILSHPQSQFIEIGKPLSLSVASAGSAPLSFQWYKNGVAISGATASTYSVSSVQSNDAGTYFVQISNSAGSVTSQSALITILTAPLIVTPPMGQTVNEGNAFTLYVEAVGSGTIGYQWLKNGTPLSGANSPAYSVLAAHIVDAGSYSVRVTNSAGSTLSATATVTIVQAPFINAQPANQNVNPGASFSLSVQAGGSSVLEYLWFKNGIALAAATNQTLAISSAQVNDAGIYSVRVSNSAGVVNSDPATVTILTAPVITKSPSNQTLLMGSGLSLNVVANGSGPLFYQWRKDGTNIPGATASIYSHAPVTSTDAGLYSVAISNTVGTVTSPAAIVTVVSMPVIVSSPVSQSVIIGHSASLNVIATGTAPLLYQWFKNGVALAGATNASFNLLSAQISDAGSYLIQVGNSAGIVSSEAAILTIITPPGIVTPPQSRTVSQGGAFTLSVQASGSGPLSYQWMKNGSAIGGATNTSYSILSAQTSDAGIYTVRVTNSAGSVESPSATMSVTVGPAITTQPLSQTIIAGSSFTLNVTAAGSGALRYQWVRNGSLIPAATNSALTFVSAQTSDAAVYTVIVSNPAGTITSDPAVVTVISTPIILEQPVTQSINEGGVLSLTVQASGSGVLTYQWFRNGSAISGASSATYSLGSVQAIDAGSYTVKVSNTAGSITSQAAIISVVSPPVITAQPQSASVPDGTRAVLSVEASGSGPLTYQWFKNGVILAGAVGPSFSMASARSSDAGSYTVQVSNPAGAVTSQPAAITILNAPAVLQNPFSQIVNEGSPFTLNVQAVGSGTLSYQWFKDGLSISGATASVYSVMDAQQSDGGTYTVRVSNSIGTIISSPATVSVQRRPAILKQPVTQTVVSGTPLVLSVEASGAGVLSYQWFRDDFALSGATNNILTISSVQPSDAGIYNVRVANAVGSVLSDSAGVSVQVGPVITKNPSSLEVSLGDSAVLSIEATGTGTLAYQWFRNGSVIGGATSTSYSIPAVSASDLGAYTVRVANNVASVTSSPANISLIPVGSPRILTQPADQNVNAGDRVTLTVVASGASPLTYRWVRNGSYISAPNMSPDLTIPFVQTSQAGSYTVEVSNGVGSAISQPANITVGGAPVIGRQPLSQTVTPGSSVTLSVEATGIAPLSYRWIKNASYISGANNATYTIPSMQGADVAAYSVEVSNFAGTVTSASALISLNSAGLPTILVQPLSQTVTPGSGLTLSVQATGSGVLEYQWLRNGLALSGANASIYSIGAAQVSDAGNYTVRITSSAGSVTSEPATVTIGASGLPQILVQPVGQSVPAGGTFNLTVQATGSGTLSYRWIRNGSYVSAASSSPLLTVSSAQGSDSGDYSVEVANVIGSIISQVATITVEGGGPPQILDQPANQSVRAGTSVTLSVVATGSAPLGYAWVRNGSYMPGANSSTYTIPSMSAFDEGIYAVEISNAEGIVSSEPAFISLDSSGPPTILEQPLGQTVNPGGSFTLSVSAISDEPITFEWFRNGVVVPSATSSFLTVSPVQSADAGIYTVRIINSKGSVTSDPAQIILGSGGFPEITVQPQGVSVSVGSPFTLSVQAVSGTSLTYQWVRNDSYIPGATASSFSVVSAQGSDAGVYSVEVSNSAGTVSSISVTVTIQGGGAPVINVQPVSQAVVLGGALNLTVQASGSGPLSYRWIRNGSYLSGATQPTLSIPVIVSSDAGSYTVEISNSQGTIVSQTAVITIDTSGLPVITSQPSSQSVPAGSAVNLVVAASGPGPITYQWFKDASTLNGANSTTFSIPSLQIADCGTYTVRVSNGGGYVTSLPAVVSIGAGGLPQILVQPSGQSVPSGGSFTLTVQATGGTLSYRWIRNGSYVSSASSDPGFTVGSAQGSDAGSYMVEISNVAGSVTSREVLVSVEGGGVPLVIVPPQSQGVAPGGTVTLTVQAAGAAPLTYRWIKNGSYLSGAISPSLTISPFQESDAGSYSVEISNASGTATSQAAIVTVDSSGLPIISTQPLTQSVPAGNSVTLSVVASGPGPIGYQWMKNGTSISGASTSTYSIASMQSSDEGSYTVRVSNNVGFITSDAAVLSLGGGGAPRIMSPPVGVTVASGGSFTLTVQATGGNLTYRWIRNGSYISVPSSSPNYIVASAQGSDAGTYSVEVSNSAGSVNSAEVLVTVQGGGKPAFISEPISQGIAPGGTLTLSVQVSGGAPLSYRWIKNGSYVAGATSATLVIAPFQESDAGSYSSEVSNAYGTVTSAPAVITVDNSGVPVITAQPQSQSVPVGSAVTLAVAASSATPLGYQWFKDGVALAGATTDTYKIESFQLANAGLYSVKVSNAAGFVMSASAGVVSGAGGPPRIVTQPIGQTVASGGSFSLTVQASGGNLTYRWIRNGSYVSASSTNPGYTVASAQASDAGAYSVEIANSGGSVTSDPAIVIIQGGGLPVVNTPPISQGVAPGGTLTLRVEVSGGAPLTYRWIRNGSYIAGGTSATLVISPFQASDAGSYSVEVSNPSGTATSVPAIITVDTSGLPIITMQPVGRSVPAGSSLSLSVIASGAGELAYQWFRNGSILSGGTNSTFTISSLKAEQSGVYTVRVSNLAGFVTSEPASISIGAGELPQISGQPAAVSAAAGTPFALQVQANGANLAYRWIRNGSYIPGATNSVFAVASAGAGDGGSYNVEVSNAAGSVLSETALVTIGGGGLPVITTQPTSQSVAPGSSVTFSVQASGGTLGYRWIRNGFSLAGATNAALTISSVQSSDGGTYTVVVSNASGSVTTEPALLIVRSGGVPTITAQPVDQALASGDPLNLRVEATGGALAYRWIHNGSYIPGATNAMLSIASVSSADAGSYSVQISNSSGSVLSQTANIVVSALTPPAFDVSVNSPAPGQPVTGLTLTFGGTGGTYEIQTCTDLNHPQWITVTTVTITDPVEIPIAMNGARVGFFRAVRR